MSSKRDFKIEEKNQHFMIAISFLLFVSICVLIAILYYIVHFHDKVIPILCNSTKIEAEFQTILQELKNTNIPCNVMTNNPTIGCPKCPQNKYVY